MIKLYNIRVKYHTENICDYKIYAPDFTMASSIAETKFKDEHTEACIFDSVGENPLSYPDKKDCRGK